jgi:thiamine-monophosphate kinase
MPTEFEFIRNIKKKYGLNRVGDDCAVLPKDSTTDLLVTADLLVEGIDFRLDWTTPQMVGQKALAVSLSDIAAMGGVPKWAMLSIGIPESVWQSGFAEQFYEGWFGLAAEHKVELIGGDVSRAPDNVVVDSIVGGVAPKGNAILRQGARPGDSIFVTGSIGGSAGGLALLQQGITISKARGRKRALLSRHMCPMPRVSIGRQLAKRSLATAMIDISDGLAADLYHLCEASGVGATIDAGTLPIDINLRDFSIDDQLAFALGGGEDFELLFTSKRKKISGHFSDAMTRIGEVTEHSGVIELITRGERQILPRTGYRHF